MAIQGGPASSSSQENAVSLVSFHTSSLPSVAIISRGSYIGSWCSLRLVHPFLFPHTIDCIVLRDHTLCYGHDDPNGRMSGTTLRSEQHWGSSLRVHSFTDPHLWSRLFLTVPTSVWSQHHLTIHSISILLANVPWETFLASWQLGVGRRFGPHEYRAWLRVYSYPHSPAPLTPLWVTEISLVHFLAVDSNFYEFLPFPLQMSTFPSREPSGL